MPGYRTVHEDSAPRLGVGSHDEQVHLLFAGVIQQHIPDGHAGAGMYMIMSGWDSVPDQVCANVLGILRITTVGAAGLTDGDNTDAVSLFQYG
jgi:hypothetical protein